MQQEEAENPTDPPDAANKQQSLPAVQYKPAQVDSKTKKKMDISHRRIELQAPEDFSYLINNVRRAAADSINAAFPPVQEGDEAQEDELRVRIEQMVDEACDSLFSPFLTLQNHKEDTY